MNTFGRNLRITTFGESHGPAIGGIIDGFPSDFKIDFDKLQKEMDSRKPGNSILVTQRKEDDRPEFLSGISPEGLTLGTPIGFIIRNKDHNSNDYNDLAIKYRPNHADFTYDARYGLRDFRGGGRASARETANWVVAGALASQWLEKQGVKILAMLTGVKNIDFSREIIENLITNPFDTDSFKIDESKSKKFEEEILKAKNNGDSVGGKVTGLITGLKPGIGDPVFRKLHAILGQAMLSINAAKGFDYGIGNHIGEITGIESLDIFSVGNQGSIITETNYSGGIQGGISNGMPVFFSVWFKPTPTVMKELRTITNTGEQTKLQMKGRHDPCVLPRAVPIVEAMTAMTILDYYLLHKTTKL